MLPFLRAQEPQTTFNFHIKKDPKYKKKSNLLVFFSGQKENKQKQKMN